MKLTNKYHLYVLNIASISSYPHPKSNCHIRYVYPLDLANAVQQIQISKKNSTKINAYTAFTKRGTSGH